MNFIVDVFPNTDVLQYQNNIIFAHECLLSGNCFSGELWGNVGLWFLFFLIYQHFSSPPLILNYLFCTWSWTNDDILPLQLNTNPLFVASQQCYVISYILYLAQNRIPFKKAQQHNKGNQSEMRFGSAPR